MKTKWVGEGGFDFITNSLWVEDRLAEDELVEDNEDRPESLREKAGDCLGVGIADLRLHQAGITKEGGGSYYPPRCHDPNNSDYTSIRRYLIYYQDCHHIVGLERLNENQSPMLATDCDHLLPEGRIITNPEPAPEPGAPVRYRSVERISNILMASAQTQVFASQLPVETPSQIEPGWATIGQNLNPPWGVRRWQFA